MSERRERSLRDDVVNVVADIHTCLALIGGTLDGQLLDADALARLTAALDRVRQFAVRSNNP